MSSQRKILVVDDDEMVREMLKIILERASYEVIMASDGVSGVEMSESERPDLVIIDGLMPKMHGFLACKVIKQLEHAPKVIILTGVYTKPTYRLEAKYEYHADEFLIKPVKPADLLAFIEKQLATLPRERSGLQTQSVSTNAIERYNPAAFEAEDLLRRARPAGYSASWKGIAPRKNQPVSILG